MKHMNRRILSLCIVICLLVTAYSSPIAVWAATSAASTLSVFDPTAGGLDFDRHTEEDGVSYADDSYRFTKKLTAVPHTYQAWVKVPSSVSGSVGCMLGNDRKSGEPRFRFGIGSNNAPLLFWEDEDGTDHTAKFTSTESAVPYDEWAHVTIVHDETAGAVRLYINGALGATDTTNYAPLQQASVMRLPMQLGGGNEFWNTRSFLGTLGDVAIYSDALSDQEVLDSYENGVDLSDESLMAFYDLSAESKHTNITDASGNGYDLQYSKLWLTEEEMVDIRKANGMLDENGEDTYDYSFAVVGDTQYVTRYYPENLSKIYQWIVDNKNAKKMQYVLGVGDITDQDIAAEWETAKNAISIMDGKIDYSLVRGNHDVKNGGDAFDTHFATDPDYVTQFKNFGGAFPEGSVTNTYRTLRVGSTDWLFLNLDWGPDDDTLDWAIDVVASHPDHKVIISTHGYLMADGSTIDASDADSVDPTSHNNGDQIWTKLASQYENVELVLCGHISMNDIVVTQNKGVHGNTVTQMLIDPQRNDYYKSGDTIYNKGGAGIVTMLYFNQDGSNVFVEHYSTIRGMYHKTCNQLTVDLDAPCEEVTEYWDGYTATMPDGAGTEEDPYLISSAAHLFWISKQIQNDTKKVKFEGHCLQVNDIDLGGFTLTSIGSYYKGYKTPSSDLIMVFAGVYDGNGYTIKNGTIVSSAESKLTVSSATTSKTAYYASGLFGMISGATIRNLTLDNITSKAGRLVVGVLVGAANPSFKGTAYNSSALNLIENCKVTSTCKAISTFSQTATNLNYHENSDYMLRVGGIAGALAYTTVRNCVNAATVYTPGNHARAGGIAGSLYNDCVVEACINRGDIVLDFDAQTSITRSENRSYLQGGIVGSIHGTSLVKDSGNKAEGETATDYKQGNIAISNCENYGNFQLKGTAPKGKAIIWGGIVGLSEELRPDTSVYIYNAVSTGTANVEKTQSITTHLGGIVGYATHAATATAQTNSSLVLSKYDNRTALPAYNQVTVNDGALPAVYALKAVAEVSGMPYETMEAALQAGGEVKLLQDLAVELSGNATIDLNGFALTLTGSGTVNAFDTSGDAFTVPTGSVTVVGDGVTVARDVKASNGNRYIAVVDGDVTTMHRLELRISTVSLRPSACGIYYKAKINCDSALAKKVSTYGVVLSTHNVPGADFAGETGDINAYTVMTPDAAFGSGTVATSGAVFNIMKTDTVQTNAQRGSVPIYVNGYIVVDGQLLIADTENVNKTVNAEDFTGVAVSLLDVLKGIDANWNRYVQTGQADAVKGFYQTWADYGMSAWADQLTNIA